jgi:hypothetical protein
MIEITKYNPVGKGKLEGTFSIKIPKWGNFYIKKMSYFRDGAKRWVNFPSEMYEQDGKKKYASYNGFEEANVSKCFQDKCLAALDDYLNKLVV